MISEPFVAITSSIAVEDKILNRKNEAEAKRVQFAKPARVRKAKPDKVRKAVRQIAPERLMRAIQYLKEHPKP